MLGKFSAEDVRVFFSSMKEGKVADAKEFRQARTVFVKQNGKIFGKSQWCTGKFFNKSD